MNTYIRTDTDEKGMIFYNQEKREIGESADIMANSVVEDMNDFPVKMIFTKVDSIDVVIDMLEELKVLIKESEEITMNKNRFLEIFESAMEIDVITHIAVKVNQPQGGFEVIVFGKDLFNTKYEYYKNAYNDEMKLKTFDKIYISKIDFSNDVALLVKEM